MIKERHMEVWSPLRWVNVRFFVSDEGSWRIKIGSSHRRPIPNLTEILMALLRSFRNAPLKYRRH